jgi:hypothetical protein
VAETVALLEYQPTWAFLALGPFQGVGGVCRLPLRRSAAW